MTDRKALIADFEKAVQLASRCSGGYSGRYLSAEEFHADLSQAVDRLKKGDMSVLAAMWTWFAPTSQWDDFVGEEGLELGNNIFASLSELKTARS